MTSASYTDDPEWPYVDASMTPRALGARQVQAREATYDREGELWEPPPPKKGRGQSGHPRWVDHVVTRNMRVGLAPNGMCVLIEGTFQNVVLRWAELMLEQGADTPGLPTYYEMPAVVLVPPGQAYEGFTRAAGRSMRVPGMKVPYGGVVKAWLGLHVGERWASLGNWRVSLDTQRQPVTECRSASPSASGTLV